jgi:hypothetical protein
MTSITAGHAANREAIRVLPVPWYIITGLLSATSIVVGLFWDIAWHRTIGRDSFWTPAHMAIYLGGVLGGAGSGYQVLKATFSADPSARARTVPMWGFRGPLGAWVSIWGAIAMLTSAPFDDWWHNAYGLDVKIISPPHMVLAMGMITLVIGARLQVLALQNTDDDSRAWKWMHIYLAGVMIAMAGIVLAEKTARVHLHESSMYRASAILFPFMLVTALAARVRWPMTAAAAVYSVIQLLQLWIFPLVPGEPQLGPVLYPVTRMVPLDFPLLLVAPALAMDVIARNGERRGWNDWKLSAALGTAFLAVLLLFQWPFADFLMSDASRNWFFFTDNHGYYTGPQAYVIQRRFVPEPVASLATGLLVALVISIASSRLGIVWWRWMVRVRR